MSSTSQTEASSEEPSRRDFIHLLAVGATGAAALGVAGPLVTQLKS